MNEEQKEIYLSLLSLALDHVKFVGKWVALDPDGKMYAYRRKPVISGLCWVQTPHNEDNDYSTCFDRKLGVFIIDNYEAMCDEQLDWRESLYKFS